LEALSEKWIGVGKHHGRSFCACLIYEKTKAMLSNPKRRYRPVNVL
jgi:hypothetical protein